MSHSPYGPNGTKWRRIAPLNRRLGQFELYSQKYTASQSADSPLKLPITMMPLLARFFRGNLERTFRRALANSVSQRVGRSPSEGGPSKFRSHGSQIFHFSGATLALPKVLLAGQGI
jgi:hypothetical protein